MGFSGGGSNVLKNHQHNGLTVQDGGSLNMDNVTQGSLTSGDIVYSDGIHLQRLPIGTTADQLVVSGSNLPSWSAAGAAGYFQLVSKTVLPADASEIDISLSPAISTDDVSCLMIFLVGAEDTDDDIFLEVNSNNSSYYTSGIQIMGGSATYTNDNSISAFRVSDIGNRNSISLQVRLACGSSDLPGAANKRFTFTCNSADDADSSYFAGGHQSVNSNSEFNNIRFWLTSNNFKEGTTVTIYKVSNV